MCTVGAVINKQRQEMKEINEYDAPEGYVAVEPGQGSCEDCAFLGDKSCWVQRCAPEERKDACDVIFIKKHERDIND